MATTAQGTEDHDIQYYIANLDRYTTRFFTWLFRQLSAVAESLMSLSAIYIIIQTAIPVLSTPAAKNTAIAIMVGAPELILPGAFLLAGRLRNEGNRCAWMVYTAATLFILLTGATLSMLFVFTKAEPWVGNVIMLFRAMTSIGYSILIRVIDHQGDHSTPASVQPGQLDALKTDLANLQKGVQDHMTASGQVLQQLATLKAELAQSLQDSLQTSSIMQAEQFQKLASGLATELATAKAELAKLATLQARLQKLEAAASEPVAPVQSSEPAPEAARARLHALPKPPIDVRSFVFDYLQSSPTCKLTELAEACKQAGFTISESSLSRYRKDYHASSENLQSSSIMQGPSLQNSTILQAVNE